jgi:hypothetical protein
MDRELLDTESVGELCLPMAGFPISRVTTFLHLYFIKIPATSIKAPELRNLAFITR